MAIFAPGHTILVGTLAQAEAQAVLIRAALASGDVATAIARTEDLERRLREERTRQEAGMRALASLDDMPALAETANEPVAAVAG